MRLRSAPPLLLGSLLILGSGCAAQKDGSEATDRGEAAVGAAATVPAAPLPECEAAAGCRLTVYSRTVSSRSDCYCPGCPEPRPAAEAAALELSWRAQCVDWAEERACMVPMCAPPPGELGCVEGRCAWQIEEGARTP